MANYNDTPPAHTAGEWHVYNNGRCLEYEILVYPHKDFRDYEHAKRICTVHKFPAINDPHYERLLANARLIAAAPNLLDACVHLLECPDLNNLDHLDIISREAIRLGQQALTKAYAR